MRLNRAKPTNAIQVAIRSDGENATVVTVPEIPYAFTPEGVNPALGQNARWTYTVCGLKAFVQFGINLRTVSISGSPTFRE